MDKQLCLGVIVMITLGTGVFTVIAPSGLLQSAYGKAGIDTSPHDAPVAVTGDNIYVTWWTNKSGNDEVMFRASNDAGKTFSDKINLSNTTDAESTRVEIDSDVNSVIVTWWETNETSDVPVMKVSTDNGKTFGELLKLGVNGTLGSNGE